MIALIFHLVEIVSHWALEIINQSGYWGIFLLSALESSAIPIPSEVVVPFAGFLAEQGRFTLWNVVLVATFANLIGGLILYFISRSGGRWFLEKFGRFLFINSQDLKKADELFEKYGPKFVFVGRMLPIVRTFISIPAGVASMRIDKFIFYSIAGSLPWNFILAYVGFKAGENWPIVGSYLHKFDFAIVILVVVFVAWYIYNHLKKK